MDEKTCALEWTNDVTGKTIERTIPKLGLFDQEQAAEFLNKGYVICINEYNDIAFASYYIGRAERMANAGETLVYPNGRVVTINALGD